MWSFTINIQPFQDMVNQLESSISLQQNQILLGTQAFASPPDMASSGVWENVILPKTPTFKGVSGILYFIIFLNFANFCQIFCYC